ncbi:MAG: hypothetical protein KTR17_03400, partial [Cellvibrionaceae bacterium]|nr:hypothetical protein [Cellvibrionaceae bacterium]
MKNIQKLPTITLLAGLITLVSCGDDNPDAESNNINIDSTLETPTLSNFRQAFSFTRDRQIDTLRADNTGGG